METLARLLKNTKKAVEKWRAKKNIKIYKNSGMVPWSRGYHEYRIEQIREKLADSNALEKIGQNYGLGLDERIVEYPWIFSKLSKTTAQLLDAGSTLNHDYILDYFILLNKHLTICTYQPENFSLTQKRINYLFADLRQLPIRDEWFDEIVCISTLEHIGMDNSMYGYDLPVSGSAGQKSHEYLKVVRELLRVLKPYGKILITVPFGKYEQHGFFQQFDSEMITKLTETLKPNGNFELTIFRYSLGGWTLSTQEDSRDEISFNPNTGKGYKDDGAAHSRAICCIEFKKS